MSNIMTSHKSKFQEDSSSTIELIAENYGANTNNSGALTDSELKGFSEYSETIYFRNGIYSSRATIW